MWQVYSYSYTGWRGFSDASGAGILRLLGGGHRISRRRDVCRDVYRWNGGSMCMHGKEPNRDASANPRLSAALAFWALREEVRSASKAPAGALKAAGSLRHAFRRLWVRERKTLRGRGGEPVAAHP
jgi:hypothetical protein